MKALIVAEKPKVALKIAANGRDILGDFQLNGRLLEKGYLESNEDALAKAIKAAGCVQNDRYIISFAEGHLVGLFQAYDYDPSYKNWRNIPAGYVPVEFRLKVSEGREYLFNNLSKLMNSPEVSEIINATDGDREGENIFRLCYRMTRSQKPYKRLWVESHSKDKLEAALRSMKPGRAYDSLAAAGYSRTKSDWLMGALLTAKTTVELGGKDMLTVGRVQTAVLAEIVRVEELNRNFRQRKYYHIAGTFRTADGKTYEGVCEAVDFENAQKAAGFIDSLMCSGQRIGTIRAYDVTRENKYSPPLFDQTSLAVEMSEKHSIDPDKTLEATQGLYEKGYATYPRTASRYITESDAADFARMYQRIATVNPKATQYPFQSGNRRIVDDSKVESHTAIIPTSEIPCLGKLTQNERTIYLELVKRVIAVNCPPAIDEKTAIETMVSGSMFKSAGTVEIQRGWRDIYDTQEKQNALPVVKVGAAVSIVTMAPKEIITKPPKRYTKATILQFMESCGKKIENEEMRELMKNKGIGTSATRAQIISNLEHVQYIETKGKTVYPTDKGIELIHKFPVEQLKDAAFTGEMEYQLYRVEKGELSEAAYMEYIIGLYKMASAKLDGKQIGKIMPVVDSLGKCPLCGGAVSKRKGQYGEFYGCAGYAAGCRFTINTICGKLLTEKQVSTLLSKGRVGPLKGLKSKADKVFEAIFVLTKDGKIELEFANK